MQYLAIIRCHHINMDWCGDNLEVAAMQIRFFDGRNAPQNKTSCSECVIEENDMRFLMPISFSSAYMTRAPPD